MAYIDNDGTIHDTMPWSVTKITSMFWGFFNVIYLYFTTLIPGFRNEEGVSQYRAPRGGGGSSGSSGSSGGGPPRPPRPRSNFRSFSDTFGRGSINGGGCPGGACGM